MSFILCTLLINNSLPINFFSIVELGIPVGLKEIKLRVVKFQKYSRKMFFLYDISLYKGSSSLFRCRESIRFNGISNLMEHIVLKEKLILKNVLNQVHNLPEMKLSSAYSRRMNHMRLGSCAVHST